MASALEDEELALSINPSHTRRGSARSPSDNSQQQLDPFKTANTPSAPSHPRPSAASAQAQMRKDRLGQYNIIKTLGEGSFGKVKLAVHAISGQKVALKIISRRKLMARDMAGRVEREIQYLQLLRHPHIIKLYTVIPMANEIIMVLEYAGSELFNYIVDHGKMIESKARQFFQQIVCAVEYCHRHKIVHRDLKPENLLLDENLHVKIADFGLSNIMTDGNFLKTSCGSPNYAAPEVISGKLYAGPEVDVWSCGVILYVLLVGRLPFDDEYIPALFKKIAQGNYHVPQYLSSGAARLIRKMLQVSPVNRITVEGIRADPWFMKDLPSYLQPPVEEFLDTGVDPAKPIDPRSLAPTKSSEVVEKLHNSVIGKLGKTMGYGREDVQQALAVDEPNAIKDAYLIVRENQIMRETPSLAREPKMERFLEQSPPVNQSPLSAGAAANQQSLNAANSSSPLKTQTQQQPRPQMQRGSVNPSPLAESRSPGGTIAVLPSSLPDYHRAYMAGQPNPSSQHKEEDPALQKHDQAGPDAKSRRPNLNPHSRSNVNLDRMARPDGMTSIHPPEKKKTRPPKWQFGIRSKNPAAEAMLAIYRALKAMGAEWEIPKTRRPEAPTSDDGATPDERKGGGDSNSASDDGTDDTDSSRRRMRKESTKSSSSRARANSQYGSWNDWGYAIPEDPWIINVRFKKSDMLPPGFDNSSASNSRVDLSTESGSVPALGSRGSEGALDHRRQDSGTSSTGPTSALSGQGSAPGSRHGSASNSRTNLDPSSREINSPSSSHSNPPVSSHADPTAATSNAAQGAGKQSTVSLSSSANGSSNRSSKDGQVVSADDSAYVYMTIQLYAIEKETYLVDFKCAGYERLVRHFFREALEDENIQVDDVNEADKSDHEQNQDDEENQSDEESASPREGMESWRLDYGSGRPREGGNWDAMRAREEEVSPSSRTRISRTDYANRQQDDDPGARQTNQSPDEQESREETTKPSKRRGPIREQLVPYGRAAEEKQVASSFPFLDVAAKLIIQLTKSD